jgi:hypothetical protein
VHLDVGREKEIAMAEAVDLSGEVRDEMAYKLAPVLKTALAAGGSQITLLEAQSCLQHQNNVLQLGTPDPGIEAVAGVRIRIRIRS